MPGNFVAAYRNAFAEELMVSGQRGLGLRAFALLYVISKRARWEEGKDLRGLEQFQCFVGSEEGIAGMTRKEFRSALAHLEKLGIVARTGANAGTLVTLINREIFDPNTKTGASEGPVKGQRRATNKRKKGEKEEIDELTVGHTDQSVVTYSKQGKFDMGEIPKTDPTPYKEIVKLYNRVISERQVTWPQCRVPTNARKQAIRARWRTEAKQDIEWFGRLFLRAADSEFLSGRNGRWTRMNFDWLMKPANIAKVLEGNYE